MEARNSAGHASDWCSIATAGARKQPAGKSQPGAPTKACRPSVPVVASLLSKRGSSFTKRVTPFEQRRQAVDDPGKGARIVQAQRLCKSRYTFLTCITDASGTTSRPRRRAESKLLCASGSPRRATEAYTSAKAPVEVALQPRGCTFCRRSLYFFPGPAPVIDHTIFDRAACSNALKRGL